MSESQANQGGASAPRERIVALVARILERNAANAPLDLQAKLNELGMSSMKMINLMLAIEVEFDVTIPQSDITPDNFDTIASVEALVVRLLASKPV